MITRTPTMMRRRWLGAGAAVLLMWAMLAGLPWLSPVLEGQPPTRLFGTGTDGAAVPITATDAGLLNVSLNGGTPSGLDGIGLDAGAYINWGATAGETGYGIRDNAGALEFKNSGGAWAELFISGAGVARGPILAPDGSAAAPSYSFATDPDTGMYWGGSSNTLVLAAAGANKLFMSSVGLSISPGTVSGSATWSGWSHTQTLNTTGVVDGVFRMAVTNTASGAGSYIAAFYGGAAGATKLFSVSMGGTLESAGGYISGSSVLAAASSSLAVSGRLYIQASSDGVGTINNNGINGLTSLGFGPSSGNTTRGSSAWNNGLVTIDMATATGTGTGTITSPTTALPVGVYLGMTCKVTTILAGAGLTTISIGDGTDADRWGTGIAIAAGTTVNVANWTADPPWRYSAATSIVVTADAGVLSTGVLSCTPHSFTFTPIGS